MPSITEQVFEWAGSQRNKTFAAAAEFVLKLPQGSVLIETGCYRGMACDGQSTLILAYLAKSIHGQFCSFDLDMAHIKSAQALLETHKLDEYADFFHGNSAETLLDPEAPKTVSFAYLDSYDFELNCPIRSQAHQLIEVGLLMPRMTQRSAFLLDDCDLVHGGKAQLSTAAILAAGYTIKEAGYQRLLVRE